jgi:ribonuclease-3 family protein
VREYYVAQANRPVGTLHSLCAGKVCAGSQAKAAAAIAEHLTQEEKNILRRGRNAHTSHTPKNSSGEDYHLATGFECLIGFLYLSGRNERIAEIFDAVRKTWLD